MTVKLSKPWIQSWRGVATSSVWQWLQGDLVVGRPSFADTAATAIARTVVYSTPARSLLHWS